MKTSKKNYCVRTGRRPSPSLVTFFAFVKHIKKQRNTEFLGILRDVRSHSEFATDSNHDTELRKDVALS